MPDKLQELTDKLYQEGLLKGRQEAEEVSKKAEEQAAKIIADAKAQAEAIVADAEKNADEIKKRTANDVKMASAQTISTLKQQVEEAFLNKAVSVPATSAMSDTEFVKKLISAVVAAFKANGDDQPLDVILPDSFKGEMDSYLKNEIASAFKGGLSVKYDKESERGFKIGPKDGGYFLSFTDGEFERMISDYLRPATKKLLFSK